MNDLRYRPGTKGSKNKKIVTKEVTVGLSPSEDSGPQILTEGVNVDPHPSEDSDPEVMTEGVTIDPHPSDKFVPKIFLPRPSKYSDAANTSRRQYRRSKQEAGLSFFNMLSSIIGTRATVGFLVFGIYLALCCIKVILISAQSTLCEISVLQKSLPCPLRGELDFKGLTDIQTKLENVQEQVAGGMSLPLQLKRAEAAIIDASSLAIVGDLPSKNEMKTEFNNFFQLTRDLGKAVRHANTMSMKTMDDLIRINTQAIKRLREIERIEAAATKQEPSHISLKALNLFAQPERSPQELLTRQYIWLLEDSKDSVVKLDVQVNVVLQIIDNIEASLHNLQELCRYDESQINAELREVHERFWTMFGFYKKEIGNLRDKAEKVQEVMMKKGEAYAIYSGVHVGLQMMSDELVDLRRKLDLPTLSFEPDHIAIGAHAEELVRTVDRLTSKKNWVASVSRSTLEAAQAQADGGRKE